MEVIPFSDVQRCSSLGVDPDYSAPSELATESFARRKQTPVTFYQPQNVQWYWQDSV